MEAARHAKIAMLEAGLKAAEAAQRAGIHFEAVRAPCGRHIIRLLETEDKSSSREDGNEPDHFHIRRARACHGCLESFHMHMGQHWDHRRRRWVEPFDPWQDPDMLRKKREDI